MNTDCSYHQTQRGPWHILLYLLGLMLLVLAWFLRQEPAISWIFMPMGVALLVLAAGFHHLTVEARSDCLRIAFGPLPLLHRTILYSDILSVNTDRTTLLDGWGIHMSLRGGWVWNIWGRDCVVLQLRKGILRVGTDDAIQLAVFLNSKITEQNPLV